MNNYTQLVLHNCIVDNLTFIKILFLISLSTCRGDEISHNDDLLCTSKMKRPVLKRSTLFIVRSEKTYKLKKKEEKTQEDCSYVDPLLVYLLGKCSVRS